MKPIILSLGAAFALALYASPAGACGEGKKSGHACGGAKAKGSCGGVAKAEGGGDGVAKAEGACGCGSAMQKSDGTCACPSAVQADAGPPLDPNKKVAAGLQYVSIKIDGMRCGGCVSHIEHALAGTRGVLDSEVVFGHGARVVFDPKQVKLEDLKKAVESAGYKTTLPST